MTRYIKSFQNANAIQEAVNNEELLKPYVAYNETTATIDYNTKKSLKETPLTFEIVSGGTIVWKATNTANTVTLEYSKNGGEWTEITSSTDGTPITVSAGDTVQFRGNSTNRYNLFGDSTAKYNIKGNIMSLIDKDNFATITNLTTLIFTNLFSSSYYYRNTGLIDASKLVLPATTLAIGCYQQMFYGCTSLTNAPELPASTLALNCYNRMFYDCTSLTAAPALPATTLVFNCYSDMFNGCTNLNYIKCLATDISASSCLTNWVSGVASSGTFVKDASMTSWTEGVSGIPTGWTVEDI